MYMAKRVKTTPAMRTHASDGYVRRAEGRPLRAKRQMNAQHLERFNVGMCMWKISPGHVNEIRSFALSDDVHLMHFVLSSRGY